MTSCTGQGNMQRPLVEIMLDGGSVVITKGNTCHSGEHTSHLNLTNSIQINTPWGQSAAVQNLEQSLGLSACSEATTAIVKRTSLVPCNKPLAMPRAGNCVLTMTLRLQGDCDRGRQFAIQLITKDLDGGGIAWPSVPWSFAKGLDAHQVVGVVGGFKAVFHRPLLKPQRDRRGSWIGRNQPKRQQSTLTTSPQFGRIRWNI